MAYRHRRSRKIKRKSISMFRKGVRRQKRRDRKYNSFRIARGGIRL